MAAKERLLTHDCGEGIVRVAQAMLVDETSSNRPCKKARLAEDGGTEFAPGTDSSIAHASSAMSGQGRSSACSGAQPDSVGEDEEL